MQWHQLDHMQTTCTLLQTDNHTNTPSLSSYRPDALPDAQATVSKHRRQTNEQTEQIINIHTWLASKSTIMTLLTSRSCCRTSRMANVTSAYAQKPPPRLELQWWKPPPRFIDQPRSSANNVDCTSPLSILFVLPKQWCLITQSTKGIKTTE